MESLFMTSKSKILILTSFLLFGLFVSTSTLAATATKTLYSWAKDASGNVSTSLNDSVAITLPEVTGDIYYVAVNGNDLNPGTITQPFATLQKLNDVLTAGDIAYIRGGTYTSATNNTWYQTRWHNLTGTANDTIKIYAYPGETPVFDYAAHNFGTSTKYLIQMYECDYVHVKGLTFTNAAQPASSPIVGFNLTNSSHNIIENITLSHIGGFGFTIGMEGWGTADLNTSNSEYNTFLNCDAFDMEDPTSPEPYGGANGFNIVHNNGLPNTYANYTTFIGCRAWNNSDDGWDFFGSESTGIVIDNSWSFKNGLNYLTNAATGDGQGFKLGPALHDRSTIHDITVKNSLAVGNRSIGFDQNTNNYTSLMKLYNNIAYNNGWAGFYYEYLPGILNVFRNNISYLNQSLFVSATIHDHNSWDSSPAVTVTNDDFMSLDVTQLDDPRKPDGSLPDITFGHLVSNSDLVNTGVDVGYPYNGSAPDIGAFETSVTSGVPSASSYYFTGPSSGSINTASTNFTVTPNGLYTGTITITPSGTAQGSLNPIILTFTNSSTPQTFTVAPTVLGTLILTGTNNGGLDNLTKTYLVHEFLPEVVVEGQNIINAATDWWDGVQPPDITNPIKLIYRNNLVTSVNNVGYMLAFGLEGSNTLLNNHLDHMIISGNKITWNGSNTSSITHGLFTGYQKDIEIKNNYIDKIPYGVVIKSGVPGNPSPSMEYTEGGFSYNIIKDPKLGVIMKGMSGVKIYNNTFYQSRPEPNIGLIDVSPNEDNGMFTPSKNTKIFNNIFYSTHSTVNIRVWSLYDCEEGFESDYNIFYSENGEPLFDELGYRDGVNLPYLTFAEWQALGYDTHSIVINPNFNNTTNLVPLSRLNYGKNLGPTWQTGLSTNAVWENTDPATTIQNGTWQVGARIYSQGQVLGSTTYHFTQNLKQGSIGNEVKELQKILISKGYLKILTPTETFGTLTFKALKEYQKTNNLTPDGIVGLKTREVLNK